MLIFGGRSEFKQSIQAIIKEAFDGVEGQLKGIKSVVDLTSKNKALLEENTKLTIDKSRLVEEHAKANREIEHKLGLHKQQVAQNIELSKREALVGVREENLKMDRKRFEDTLEFHEKRFTEEVGYLKDTIKTLADRLPSMEMTADLSPASRRKR